MIMSSDGPAAHRLDLLDHNIITYRALMGLTDRGRAGPGGSG
jgi:hypothetical protein